MGLICYLLTAKHTDPCQCGRHPVTIAEPLNHGIASFYASDTSMSHRKRASSETSAKITMVQ